MLIYTWSIHTKKKRWTFWSPVGSNVLTEWTSSSIKYHCVLCRCRSQGSKVRWERCSSCQEVRSLWWPSPWSLPSRNVTLLLSICLMRSTRPLMPSTGRLSQVVWAVCACVPAVYSGLFRWFCWCYLALMFRFWKPVLCNLSFSSCEKTGHKVVFACSLQTWL